jgi:hypothetical protein
MFVTMLFNTMNMADNNRGRVEEKRPADEKIADHIENSEPV